MKISNKILESLEEKPATKDEIGKTIYNLDGKKATIKSVNAMMYAVFTEFFILRCDSPDWFWQNPIDFLK
jgi:hypothetical protein